MAAPSSKAHCSKMPRPRARELAGCVIGGLGAARGPPPGENGARRGSYARWREPRLRHPLKRYARVPLFDALKQARDLRPQVLADELARKPHCLLAARVGTHMREPCLVAPAGLALLFQRPGPGAWLVADLPARGQNRISGHLRAARRYKRPRG